MSATQSLYYKTFRDEFRLCEDDAVCDSENTYVYAGYGQFELLTTSVNEFPKPRPVEAEYPPMADVPTYDEPEDGYYARTPPPADTMAIKLLSDEVPSDLVIHIKVTIE